MGDQLMCKRHSINTDLNDTTDKARDVRDGACVACAKIRTVQHPSRDQNQGRTYKRLCDIEECAFCGRESESDDDERELLRGIVGKLVEEHVQTKTSASTPSVGRSENRLT